MRVIPIDFYSKIIDAMPILCVDIVIKDMDRFLLVKRTREPLKGRWWVPGGRVWKGETITSATKRKIKEELGINVKVLEPIGYYERHFKESELGLESGIHTVSIVVTAKPLSFKIKLDNQSSAWRFTRRLPRDFKIKPFRLEANR
jgi:colanic acid biosynthesis protein WcaH